MAYYPQIRHELSRISLRKLSRRHCLPRSQRLFEIERKPHEVPRLVQSVQTNADSNRDALGFLPAQAYEQAARQGTLFVAVDRRGPGVALCQPYFVRSHVISRQDLSGLCSQRTSKARPVTSSDPTRTLGKEAVSQCHRPSRFRASCKRLLELPQVRDCCHEIRRDDTRENHQRPR
jgi:hypothetical protein